MINNDFIQIVKDYNLDYYIGKACECLILGSENTEDLQQAIEFIQYKIGQINDKKKETETCNKERNRQLLNEAISPY